MTPKIFLTAALALALALAPAPPAAAGAASFAAAGKYLRAELYFGMDVAGGGRVSAAEWEDFLEREVAPRFPRGFTVVEAAGRYLDAQGRVVREPSRVLIVLYPKKSRAAAGLRLDEIREAYKKRFGQESVMRVDFKRAVDVDF